MPELSRFLGIIIRMRYREHAPAHFHAEYGDYEITVAIDTGVVTGTFPRRALSAVLEWFQLHQAELKANWEAAMQRKPLTKIEPLE
ncbi:MAG: transcriptional regulator [Deltaproteobacteria bacterium RIFOXYA12_FULL_61_11]|nr:MAG: transcriptional regulator [Deltaproteobacteria bacterium RIFOXYA12_FULL_61_11]